MSERMDPEDVKSLADSCIERLSQEIRRFGGTVINVIGDEVVAVFGAPVAHEDDAERAVRAGLAMCGCKLTKGAQDQAEPKGDGRSDGQSDGELPIKVHVGINTGEVMAGLTGPQGRRDYNVMGDTINTAARLLSAAPPGRVYVGLETYRATQRVVRYGELPPIFAKGKEQLVPAWEALAVIDVPQARPLGSAPLIGRDNELNLLLSLWERANRSGQPHLVTLLESPASANPPSAEFSCACLPKHGAARALPAYGEALGYSAAMLKEAANITADDTVEQSRSKLGALVDRVSQPGIDDAQEIALHLALLSGLDTEADRLIKAGDQHAMHASGRRFLEALALLHPLCLIFEDIHWADDVLLNLIEFIAGRIRSAPLLIVTLARPELFEKRPSWGHGVRAFTSLPLHPLPEDMENELIIELCRERGTQELCADEIGHRPGGNPLFAEEMVAMIAERGQVTGVPSLIKLLIAARFDALPVGERNIIQLAAVFGKTFWESGLRALGAGTRRDIREHLEALEQKDLLRSQPRSQFRDEGEFIFKHDLIQDVAYNMLPRSERQTLHGLVVDWLEERPDKTFDMLAHHAVQAGQHSRAVHYLMQAAEGLTRGCHRQEAVLLSEALSWQ
jgi:class 3 adenylate cyclase